MPHNSEDLIIKRKTPIAAPLDCQTTAKRRNLLDSLLQGRLLAPPGRFFCLFPTDGHGSQFDSKSPVDRPTKVLDALAIPRKGETSNHSRPPEKRNKPNFLQPICNQWTTAGPSVSLNNARTANGSRDQQVVFFDEILGVGPVPVAKGWAVVWPRPAAFF